MHNCYFDSPCGDFGPAIDSVAEREDGTLWATNGEYISQVNFCPSCGYEAKVKVAEGLIHEDIDCGCLENEGC